MYQYLVLAVASKKLSLRCSCGYALKLNNRENRDNSGFPYDDTSESFAITPVLLHASIILPGKLTLCYIMIYCYWQWIFLHFISY